MYLLHSLRLTLFINRTSLTPPPFPAFLGLRCSHSSDHPFLSEFPSCGNLIQRPSLFVRDAATRSRFFSDDFGRRFLGLRFLNLFVGEKLELQKKLEKNPGRDEGWEAD